jgi:hypothetical protein
MLAWKVLVFSDCGSRTVNRKNDMMKRVIAIVLGLMLLGNITAQAEVDAADKKWLETIEKIIAKGETSIPTTSAQRMAMLKDWASKKGYAVMVGKNELGYHVELFPKIALK